MKKLIAIIVTLSMLLTLSVSSVYASNWLDEVDCEEVFGVSKEYLTSLSDDELENLKEVYDFTFNSSKISTLYPFS